MNNGAAAQYNKKNKIIHIYFDVQDMQMMIEKNIKAWYGLQWLSIMAIHGIQHTWGTFLGVSNVCSPLCLESIFHGSCTKTCHLAFLFTPNFSSKAAHRERAAWLWLFLWRLQVICEPVLLALLNLPCHRGFLCIITS